MKLAKFPPGVPALDEFDLAFPPLWPTNRTPSSFRVPDQNWDQQDRPVRISSSSLDIPLKMGGQKGKLTSTRSKVNWLDSWSPRRIELSARGKERILGLCEVGQSSFIANSLSLRAVRTIFDHVALNYSVIFGGLAKCKFRHFWRITFEMIS